MAFPLQAIPSAISPHVSHLSPLPPRSQGQATPAPCWALTPFLIPLLLVPQESEKLESVNAELKAQIEELKNEKQHLIYMLNLHRPTCIVRAQNGRTPEDERNLFIQQIKEGTLQS